MEETDIVMPDLNGKNIAKRLTGRLPYFECPFMSDIPAMLSQAIMNWTVLVILQINVFKTKSGRKNSKCTQS